MAKVLRKGTTPVVAAPAAAATMPCSAAPMLKKRSGKALANLLVRVEPARSASKTTMFAPSFPNSTRVSP